MKLRDHVWSILNDPEDSRYKVFLSVITLLILASVSLLFIETFGNVDPETYELLETIDATILGIFLIEYLARLWVIRNWLPRRVELGPLGIVRYFVVSRIRYILSPWGFIDFLALLPLVPFLRSLRILRLLRLFRSVRLFRYSSPVEALFSALRTNSLLFAVASGFVLSSVVLSATMFFFAEFGQNTKVNNIGDALWWAFVTITTVGYGDISPETGGGRIIGSVLMVAGMFLVALFAGLISSTLVDRLMPLQQEQFRMSSITDHIIISGWNDNVLLLLEQLEAEARENMPEVLVLAPISRPEKLPPKVHFVHGDFTLEAEYDKVRLKWARAVIIVSDTTNGSGSSGTRDANVVMTAFTLRSVEREFASSRRVPLHICAEILLPENVDHARAAGADEVLATALVGNSLLAHTVTNPGVSPVLNTMLLTAQDNIYTTHMPPHMIEGKTITFEQVQLKFRKEFKVLVLGVIHAGQIKLNPDHEMPVFLDDEIVYLGDRAI